jgi:hypothetical protein
MVDWDKSRVQLVQLGEKVIQMDIWQEDKLTQMMAQLHQELEEKEEALEKLQAVVQETKEAKPPSIATFRGQHHDQDNSSKLTFLRLFSRAFW